MIFQAVYVFPYSIEQLGVKFTLEHLDKVRSYSFLVISLVFFDLSYLYLKLLLKALFQALDIFVQESI